MCLSTVYSGEMKDEKILMKNVMLIECKGSKVILTDLMERKCEIEGTLAKADLTEGYVILNVES